MAQTARLELEADSSQITSATRQLKNLQTQGSATEKATGKMTTSANTATKAMGGMGRSAGQVGIQVQQLVGQVQGGQNVFQAFSAQAADIGIVMGAPLLGVIAAFGGAIAGTLLPNLFDAEEAVEDFTGALREMAAQQQLTAEQAAVLSEAEGRKVAENLEKRAKLTEQLTELEAQAQRQRGAIQANSYGQSEKTRSAFDRYTKGLQENLAEQNNLKVALIVVNKEVENASKNIIAYNNNIGDGSESTQTMNDRIARLTDSLTNQKVALEQGELQGQLYAAAQATGADSVDDLDSGVKKLIIDIHAAKDAKVAEAQATRDLIAAEREQANAQKAFDNVSSSIEADQGGSIAKIEQEYQERLAVITAYEQSIGEAVGSSEAVRLAALSAFEEKKTDVLKTETEQRKALEEAANNEALGAAATVFGNLADIAKEGGEDSFQAYKNLASAQAAINAALAITNVLGSPFTAVNPIAGAALATTIGGVAAVQVANIQSQEYSGYEQGGYTGNYGTKEVAGVVHGQEFVLNAAATKKNRPLLEAMNQGKDVTSSNSGTGQTLNQDTVNVNVVSASNEQVTQQILQNMDLIYNGISRAKRARGQTF